MIGFLRKDLYGLYGLYRKNMLLVFVFYTIFTFVTDMDFLLYMMIWMMGFYSISSLTLDQSSGWDRYARTLPATGKQVIGAKFLVTILFTLIGVAFALLIGTINWARRGAGYAGLEEILVTVGVITAIALLAMGLLLPASIKWGVEKARNGYLVAFMLVFAVPMLFKDRLEQAKSFFNWFESLSVPAVVAGAMAVGLAVFAVGYVVSCRIYEKQEF